MLFLGIGGFRIVGFYLYHVIVSRPSDSNGTLSFCKVLFDIDYDRGSAYYYGQLTALVAIS